MAIEIKKTFQLKEPIEQVWSLLSDPRRVAACVPGAKITEQVDEKTYKGTISVKVGPSATDYKGELEIVRLDAANHEIEILGKGQDVRGRGSASMKMTGKLRSLEDGGTEVKSISEVNVVGILAQMGSRMINEVSNVIPLSASEDFFPSIPAASLALGNVYRVGFLSPFQATLALRYKTKGGFSVNPVVSFNKGYPIGQGLIGAVFFNGKAVNVPLTKQYGPLPFWPGSAARSRSARPTIADSGKPPAIALP